MTGRQRAASAAAAGLGLIVVVASVSGRTDLAVGGVGLLLAGLTIVLLDVRRRQGDIARRLKQVAQRQKTDSRRISQLGKLPSHIISASRRSLESATQTMDLALGRVETAGEGLLTGMAHERLAAAERHVDVVRQFGEVSAGLAGVSREVGEARNDVVGARDQVVNKVDQAEQSSKRRQIMIREHIARLEYEPVRQIQALLQLLRHVEPRAPLPPTGGWAVEPSTLLRLVQLVESARPSLVVECGSGTSTVWLAYTLQSLGHGRVVALEHDERYARETQRMLDDHGLSDVAEVRLAPLSDIKINDESYRWYDLDAVNGLEGIELLLVDGPPRASGPRARYPALPLLADKLVPGAKITLDDVDRAAEQEALEAWLAEYPNLEREASSGDRTAMLIYGTA